MGPLSGCQRERVNSSDLQETLDPSKPAPTTEIVTWYCAHPFHGIRLDLGDARADVEQHCAACTLPRPQSDEDET